MGDELSMRRVWLDFVQVEPGRHWPGWLALVLALALTIGLAIHNADLNEQVAQADARVHALQRKLDRERAGGAAAQGASTASDDLGKLIAARRPARWEEVFASLEASTDESITLLSLYPEGGNLTVSGEAKHLAAATDYLKRLKARPRFGNAYLADYETVRDHPQRPLRFTIVAPAGEAT